VQAAEQHKTFREYFIVFRECM